jgi:hypothetical protein
MSPLTGNPTCKRFAVLAVLQSLLLAPAVAAADVAFSTFLSGSRDDFGEAIARTPEGGVVIVGRTHSSDFPTVRGLKSELSGLVDAFVLKLDATGSRIEFATYLGGSSVDSATAVAVDPSGNIYVAGSTVSEDFPTVGGFDHPRSGEDGFLTKLSPDGQTILFSTYLGGSGEDFVEAVVHQQDGRVFVAGGTDSIDFPGLPAVTRRNRAGAFVASVDTADSRLVFSEFLAGRNLDFARHIVWNAKHQALWVAGRTESPDFPSIRPLRQTSRPVVRGGFLARLLVTEDTVRLKSSSILPAPVRSLAVDRKGRTHLSFGETHRQGGWEDLVDRCSYSLYFRVQANGRRLQNTQCLPTWTDALKVDRKGRVVVVGRSRFGLPLLDPIQDEADGDALGGGDFYVAVLAKGVKRLLFGTYFGGRSGEGLGHQGLAISESGKRILLTGYTYSIDYPLVSAVQPEKLGANPRPGAVVTELRASR